MKTIIIFIAALVFNFSNTSQSEFVCLPCGSPCDSKVHSGAGSCPVCNMALVEKSKVNFSNLTPADFCMRMASNPNAIVLDVRSAAEFDGSTTRMETFGHFKNAINIPIDQLEARIDELAKYKEKEILVYCSHSHRSPQASYLLGTKGFENVKNMSGGVSTIQKQQSANCYKNAYIKHSH